MMTDTATQTQAQDAAAGGCATPQATPAAEPRAAPRRVAPYELLGGETALRTLVDRFYDIMDSAPEAATIRAMHGRDLSGIRQKLFEWLSGWLGGPPLFAQRTGSVCITAAHKPYAIDAAARDEWMFCMHKALDDLPDLDPRFREALEKALLGVADFMRNR
jgi:hemoglobin